MDHRHEVTVSRIGLQGKRSTCDAVSTSDLTILRTWLALSTVFLIAIYLASIPPSTASGEFASMTVFP